MVAPANLAAAGAVVAGALLIIVCERAWPYDARQALFRRELFGDLVFYGLAQSYVVGLAITAFVQLLARQAPETGPGLVSGWPLGLQVVFFLLTHDFYIYWFHRAQHASSWLWRLHEAHHAPQEVDWISGAKSHALEIMINETVDLAPIVLLGAHPWVVPIKLVVDVLTGMYIHSNVDIRRHPRWLAFVNGPHLHRWHHAVETASRNVNFGTKLAVWDHLFGTASLPKGKPHAYGVVGHAFPRGFWRQQWHAFGPRDAFSPRSRG